MLFISDKSNQWPSVMKKHSMMGRSTTNRRHVSPKKSGRVTPIDHGWWLGDLFLVGNGWHENGGPHSLYIM